MNGYLISASAIGAVTVLVHLIAGHRNPVVPMLGATFDDVAKRTMHACWHAVSVTLILSSLALLAAGVAPDRWGAGGLLAEFVAVQFSAFTVVFIVIAVKTRVGIAALPQPALFVPIAVLAWLGR